MLVRCLKRGQAPDVLGDLGLLGEAGVGGNRVPSEAARPDLDAAALFSDEDTGRLELTHLKLV